MSYLSNGSIAREVRDEANVDKHLEFRGWVFIVMVFQLFSGIKNYKIKIRKRDSVFLIKYFIGTWRLDSILSHDVNYFMMKGLGSKQLHNPLSSTKW